MKRINLLFMSLLCVWISATAQVGQQSQEPVDSIKNIGYMDSLFQELPEVMITGERPIVKAEQGNSCMTCRDWWATCLWIMPMML